MPGIATLAAEVTQVSRNGLWLLLGDEELLLSFEHFPWFCKASIDQLTHVERPTSDHVYWPDLDIDLSIESIRKPAAVSLDFIFPAPFLITRQVDEAHPLSSLFQLGCLRVSRRARD